MNKDVIIFGDLSATGRLNSYGVDTDGGSSAPATATWEVCFPDHSAAPAAPLRLPEGLPPMVVTGFRDIRHGPIWKRTYTLKAKSLQPGGGYPPRDRNNPIYRLQTTLEEAPLATHPNIEKLVKKYAGKVNADGTVEFPPFYTQGADGAGLVADREGLPNPMWGVRTWRAVSIVFSARYFMTKASGMSWAGTALDATGTIDRPQHAPSIPGRDWLHLGMSVEVSGELYSCEESWLASQPGGWFADLYSRQALAKGLSA